MRIARFDVGLVVAAAVVLWLVTFFGTAWGVVWLIEKYEGPMYDCYASQCGTYGEFLDDHDALAALGLAAFALLPPAFLFWAARRHFVIRHER